MEEKSDQLEFFRKEVEKKTNWGPYQNWQNRDFIYLSDLIHEKTNERISVSTLKRIFGKNASKTLPKVSTLNALANFLDFNDWKEFLLSNKPEASSSPDIKQEKEESENTKYFNSKYILLVVALLLIGSLSYYLINRQESKVNLEDISFSIKEVNGISPHSIQTTYKVPEKLKKKARIKQYGMGMDPIYVMLANRDAEGSYNLLIRNPGIYKVGLEIDGKEYFVQECMVTTEKWEMIYGGKNGATDQQLIPFDSIVNNGELYVEKDKIKSWGMDNEKASSKYIIVDEQFKEVAGDTLVFKTRVKSLSNNFSHECGSFYITLLGSESFLSIGFAHKGCFPTIKVILPGKLLDAEIYDLSSLAIELNQWIEIELRVSKNNLIIKRDGKEVFQESFTEELGTLGGAKFHFLGSGKVDYFTAKSDKDASIVYDEQF